MMKYLPCIAIGILSLLVLVLLSKIRLMRRSLEEIERTLEEKLEEETNALAEVSSGDPAVKGLASALNARLRLLDRDRRLYRQGHRELKETVEGLAHDLRTPLTAIRGYLDLLEREEKSEKAGRYLRQIRDRTEAMTDLTEELFAYSRAVSVRPLSPERMDLVRALEESLVSFYGAVRERGLEPRISLPEGPLFRYLDRNAVDRVFSNILSNALKYSDGDFCVRMEKDGAITFSNKASGLDPLAVQRLFDCFHTVESGRETGGIGLSVARALMERMGGEIGADYREGRLSIRLVFPP